MVWGGGADSVRVKVAGGVVPAAASGTVGLDTEMSGGGGAGAPPSSSTMVPSPWLSASTAPTGEDRLTKNVSLGSTVSSPVTVTVTVAVVTPGAKLTGVVASAV